MNGSINFSFSSLIIIEPASRCFSKKVPFLKNDQRPRSYRKNAIGVFASKEEERIWVQIWIRFCTG